MKPLIVVPTKNRIDRIGKYTLRWLVGCPFDWVLVVEPQEEALYRKFFTKEVTDHLLVLPKNNRGLGYALQHVKFYALTYKYDVVWKVDDDVVSWGAWFAEGQRGKKNRASSQATFIHLVNDGLQILQNNPKIGAISYPYRGEMFNYGCTMNKRTQTCYAVRTEDWVIVDDTGNFEDFIVSIGVWKNHKHVLRYSHTGIDALKVGGNPGGFQSYERGLSSKVTMQKIMATWPDIVARTVENRAWTEEPDMRKIEKPVKMTPKLPCCNGKH